MALFSIVDQIKNGIKGELKKNPEVLKSLETIDTGIQAAEKLLARLGPAEWTSFLTLLNNSTGNKFTAAEIAAAASEMSQAGAALAKLDTLVQEAEVQLKG